MLVVDVDVYCWYTFVCWCIIDQSTTCKTSVIREAANLFVIDLVVYIIVNDENINLC